jgi:hypothetical protein
VDLAKKRRPDGNNEDDSQQATGDDDQRPSKKRAASTQEDDEVSFGISDVGAKKWQKILTAHYNETRTRIEDVLGEEREPYGYEGNMLNALLQSLSAGNERSRIALVCLDLLQAQKLHLQAAKVERDHLLKEMVSIKTLLMRGGVGVGGSKRGSGGDTLSIDTMSRGWLREEFCRIFAWPENGDAAEYIKRKGAATGFSEEDVSRFIKTQANDFMKRVRN